jgi:proteic killer suppression protein
MILSYGDRRTADFVAGKFVATFQGFAAQAERRLAILEAADGIADLAALRSNRFEALRGDRRGQYSIRINDQWRLVFEWPSGSKGPTNVVIVDYH